MRGVPPARGRRVSNARGTLVSSVRFVNPFARHMMESAGLPYPLSYPDRVADGFESAGMR